MDRYMGEYYWTRTTHDLAVLRSKKHNRVVTLERQPLTYFNKKELKKLREQIKQIDAVIAARAAQVEMFKDL